MIPLPVRQFAPDSRLVIDANDYHFCAAGTPALAAEIVKAVNAHAALTEKTKQTIAAERRNSDTWSAADWSDDFHRRTVPTQATRRQQYWDKVADQ